MIHLDEDVLSAALKEAVPEPVADPDLANRARMQARRLRTRRRGAMAAAVAAVGALGIGAPALVSTMESRSIDGPADGVATTRTTEPRPCAAEHACGPAGTISAIRQPLRLADVSPGKRCPASPVRRFSGGAGFSGPFSAIGPGPLYVTGLSKSTRTLTVSAAGGSWLDQKVIWVIDRSYSGALLMRGRRIDGAGDLRFLRYIGAVGYTEGAGDGMRREVAYVRSGLTTRKSSTLDSMPSGVYVQSPGCYAIQIDGVGFSEVLVFKVRLSD